MIYRANKYIQTIKKLFFGTKVASIQGRMNETILGKPTYIVLAQPTNPQNLQKSKSTSWNQVAKKIMMITTRLYTMVAVLVSALLKKAADKWDK